MDGDTSGDGSGYRLTVASVEHSGAKSGGSPYCYGLVDFARGAFIVLLYLPPRPPRWTTRANRPQLRLVLAGIGWSEVLIVDGGSASALPSDSREGPGGGNPLKPLWMVTMQYPGRSLIDTLQTTGEIHLRYPRSAENKSVALVHRGPESADILITPRPARRGLRQRLVKPRARLVHLALAPAEDRLLLRPPPASIPPREVNQWDWDESFTPPTDWDNARHQIARISSMFQ